MKKLFTICSIIGVISIAIGCTEKEVLTTDSESLTTEYAQNSETKTTIDEFTYGLFWYGANDQYEKHEIGKNNSYFDPSKPVVIFFHGQSPSAMTEDGLWTTYWNEGSTWVETGWLEKGYNVGIFHWETWADEDETTDAEAKIYTRDGPQGFRYKLSTGYPDDGYPLNPEGDDAIGEIAYNYVSDALINLENTEVRFAGHSLGAQLSSRVAYLLHTNILAGNIDQSCRVSRLALLDPAWTKDGKSWWNDDTDLNDDANDDWVGERTRWSIFEMMDYDDDFAVEIYSTTALDLALGVAMDNNADLREKVCCTSLRPWYFNAIQFSEKHNAAYYHYMYSMAYDAPTECTINWYNKRSSTGHVAASASTSTERIVTMMNSSYYWDQVEGRYTFSPEDDWFERKNR